MVNPKFGAVLSMRLGFVDEVQSLLSLTLHHKNLLHSTFGHLVKDTLSSTNSLRSFSFSHVYRQDNALPHVLVKRVTLSFPVFDWIKDVDIC